MISFKDLKVGVKLGMGFGVLLALTLLVAVTAYLGLSTVAGSTDLGGKASTIVEMILQARQIEKNFILRGEDKYVEDHQKKIVEVQGLAAQALAGTRDKGIRELLAKAGEQVGAYAKAFQDYVALEKRKQTLTEVMRADGRDALNALQSMWEDQDADFKRSAESGAATADLADRQAKADDAARLTVALLNLRRLEKEYILSGDPKLLEAHQAGVDSLRKDLPALRARYRKAKNIEAAETALKDVNGYAASFLEYVQLTGKQEAADKDMVDNAREAQKSCRSALDLVTRGMESDISLANLLIIGGAGMALLLGLTAALLLTRLITGPLRKGVFFATKVAEGDLNQKLDVVQRDEVGVLAEAMRKMVAELKNKLGFAQGVLDGFVLPCAVFDTDNKATFINAHMMAALDKDGHPSAHYGENSGQFVYGDPGRETLILKALREKRRLDLEVEYTTGKGAAKVFQATSTPINDLDGNLLGVLATWFELTEIRGQQKKIETQNVKIAEAATAANTVSDQVASASEELSAQIEQSSRGSEEQRNRTGEAATAMEEMNATVMEVAKSASTAAELADKAKAKAQEGEHLVDEVVNTVTRINEQAELLKTDMTELGKQAEGIGQIMNVIADIADQTNLLALNAAIEAARAGDAGRGFAVVADEVRKLAEKTMNATNEVGAYIKAVQESAQKNIQGTEATTKAIGASTEMAGKSGAALREIVDMVEKTADQVRGIATASEQQSAASEEISRTTEDINRIAGETAEAMTQSAQAVSDLARLAMDLKSIITDMQQS